MTRKDAKIVNDAMDLMEPRKIADEVSHGKLRLGRRDLTLLADGFRLCDRLRAEAVQQVQDIEIWFREGNVAAEMASSSVSPYGEGTLANHWWTRGYSYVIRLMRAHASEAAIKEKR